MTRTTRALALLYVLLTSVTLAGGEEGRTNYFRLFLKGKRVGYVVQEREVKGERVHTRHETAMTFHRGPTSMTIRDITHTVATSDGEPVRFSSRQDLGGAVKWVTGRVDPNGVIRAEIVTGEDKQRKRLPWPQGAVLGEAGTLSAQRKHGLESGTRYELRVFMPSMLRTADVTVEVGPVKAVTVSGKTERLHQIATTTRIDGVTQHGTAWATDEYELRKMTVELMGLELKVVASSRKEAMMPAESFDILMSTSVASPEPLGDVCRIERMVCELTPTDGRPLKVPNTGFQSAQISDGRTIVKVRPGSVKHAEGEAPADPGEADLAPTEYLNSDDEKVRDLARQAVEGEESPAGKARAIERFVFDYIEEKNLGTGWASAARVARNPKGDCSEHAVLAAAMCRATGIPARVISGIVYGEGPGGRKAFWPHAWFTAWDGEHWVDHDPTFSTGFDATHLALATGDGSPQSLMAIAETLGRFRITRLAVER